MDRKEILEVKKTLETEHCCVTRLRCCLVGTEKDKAVQMKKMFQNLPEEEMHKYLGMLKKAFSGTAGKNLDTFEFAKNNDYKNDAQNLLLAVRDSALEDDRLAGLLFDRVIDAYDSEDAYFIALAYGVYDVPDKNGGGSEYAYQYILCCICPLDTPKAGLCYVRDEHAVRDMTFNRLVGAPEAAFLFPAFHGRNQDIHSILYHTKKDTDLHGRLIEALGCVIPMTCGMQKETYEASMQAAFPGGVAFGTAVDVKEEVAERIAEDAGAALTREDIGGILDGCSGEIDRGGFSEAYASMAGDNCLLANNIINKKETVVKGDFFTVSVKDGHPGLLTAGEYGGRKCIIVEIDGAVTVDGLPVKV
ncbi:MAG: DUF4317 domain-containing protein [Clostridiales bacterium]|nr:DUF4317 domain-containing protein [Clostridiales bacterium]